jgi:multiple sugar transport system substrate-binding protein
MSRHLSLRGRRRALALAAAGGLAVVAGGLAAAPATASGEPVTVTFWNGFTGPDRPVLEQLVDEFNGAQDSVTIEMEISPWDQFFQRLLPSLASDDGPDLVAMDTAQLPQYIVRGAFRPLDDYYEDSATESDALVQAAVDATKWDDVAYGVPMNFTTLLLYWNKDLFEEAGLDPETPPATWEEFADAAVQLTGDGQYGLAIADNNTIPMWPILLWGNGGGVVSDDGTTSLLDAPETIEALEYWGGLVMDEGISPIGLAGADADNLFQTGRAAMEIVGPWMTTGFTEAGLDFGVAPPPEGPAGPVTLGTSVAFAINNESDDATAEAAMEFIKFWNSTDSQITWALGSGFPPTRTDIPADALAENPFTVDFGAPADISRFYLTNVQNFTEVNTNIFEATLQRFLNGEGSAEELFTSASQEVQTLLDQQ